MKLQNNQNIGFIWIASSGFQPPPSFPDI